MQVLWCPNDHKPEYCPDVRVFWRRRLVKSALVESQPEPTLKDEYTSYLPSPCLLHPERIAEYPDPEETMPEDWIDRLANSREMIAALKLNKQHATRAWKDMGDAAYLYQCGLSTADGTKLGGYPNWVQWTNYPKCQCGRSMEHLLSFASREFSGSSWYRWLPVEERDVLRGKHELLTAVNGAANCMFGDAGNLYVFICRKCPDWPVQASMQYS